MVSERSRKQARTVASPLGLSLAVGTMAAAGIVAPTMAAPSVQAAPVVSAPTTTYAIVREISGLRNPRAVAVNSVDDTVYVGSGNDDTVYVLDGRAGTLTDSLEFGGVYDGGQVFALAVNAIDDTVYATVAKSPDFGLALLSGAHPRDDSAIVATATVKGLAVNSTDDSVYSASGVNPSAAFSFDGRSGSAVGTVGLGRASVDSVAVNARSGRLYASGGNNVSVIDEQTFTVTNTIPIGTTASTTFAVAVDQSDDTVYALNYFDRSVSVIDGSTNSVAGTVSVGVDPYAVAVDQADDTVYVTNLGSESLSVIDGRSAQLTDDTISLGVSSRPYGVAVDDAGANSGVVYVTNDLAAGSLSVIARVTPTIWPPAAPVGNVVTLTLDVPQVAYDVDNASVTTVYFDDTAVTPTAGAGDTWTVTVPPGATGRSVPVTVKLRGGLYASAGTFTFGPLPSEPILNSATGGLASIDIAWTEVYDGGSPITDVYYAIDGYTRRDLDDTVSPSTITTDSSGNPLAAGTTYTVRIQVRNAAGYTSSWSNALTATTNSNPTPPTPPVTNPPGPPTDVVAVAGDANATVAWSAPADSGSFPISDYEVTASPGGAGCLVKVPATTCTVDDLANGTTYTFSVRALNGAGWGASSESSNAVTPDGPKPTPSIMVTGSRGMGADADRVFANGVTTHLVGRQVQARVHLSGQVNYENGSVRTVASDGSFTWQRRTKKTVYVYFRVADEPGVRSNRLIIRLNRP